MLRLPVFTFLAVLGLAFSDAGTCDEAALLDMHHRLGPVVAQISELHFGYTGGRHYEVVEIVNVYQVDRLCRGALNFVESLRLSLCFLLCPSHCVPSQLRAGDLVQYLRLSEYFNSFFTDVRHVAQSSEDKLWDSAENEMLRAATHLQSLVQHQSTQAVKPVDAALIEPLWLRLLAAVVDFLEPLLQDLSAHYRAPNYITAELIPEKTRLSRPPATVGVIKPAFDGTRMFETDFMTMLHDPLTVLTHPSFFPTHQVCDHSAPAATAAMALEFTDGLHYSHSDVSGIHRRLASPIQMLQAISLTTRLSNLFVSLTLSSEVMAQKPSCGGKLVLYDPSYCLKEHGWGGYFFEVNPLPPYNLTVVYAGKPLGPSVNLPVADVHSIHVDSRSAQWSSLVSTYKSVNHHSPDVLFLSPFVGNCLLVERLLGSGPLKPKLVYVPINPLLEPPDEVIPDLHHWWTENEIEFVRQILSGSTVNDQDMPATPVTASVWLAQCSLSATSRILQKYDFSLTHLEHMYAVFVWRPLHVTISPMPPSQEEAWLAGWKCAPMARYVFDLEIVTGPHVDIEGVQQRCAWLLEKGIRLARSGGSCSAVDPNALQTAGVSQVATSGVTKASLLVLSMTSEIVSRDVAKQLAATEMPEVPTLKYFLERPVSGTKGPRGRCIEGRCECFVPYRGPRCERQDPARQPQTVSAAVHYTMAESEQDLKDIELSLKTLWERFNHQRDYPVIIFHEGLSPAARRRIVEASENRVWLAYLPRFTEIPAEWASACAVNRQNFSIGYRAMIRWRSGPLFLEPALAQFDYAMTLDTDSYFPGNVDADPFEFIHQNDLVAAFPHLGRESASVVLNFLHYFLLYCKLREIDPRGTKMLVALVEKNFKWYQQCMMLDIEVLRLDWFRSGDYQDFFRYMDSTGGFWLYRWGNNPFRTFAVAALLNDSQVRAMELPYAHQDHCSCGKGHDPCQWSAQLGAFQCNDEDEGSRAGVSRISAFALDEGLEDLQPWRGTERQLAQFNSADVERFIQEQSLEQ